MMRWNGKQWVRFGDLLSGSFVTRRGQTARMREQDR